MQQFSGSLPMMLYAALDAVMPRFRAIFKEFGLTEQQWRVLRVLWEQNEIGSGELAALTHISAPSLVGVIDRLVKMQLVQKQRSANDRRVVYISITASGQQLERQVMPRVNKAYAELQASLDQATWTQLLEGLQALADAPGVPSAESPG